jgi:histidine ammonia-lyase
LATPASIDTILTCQLQEDTVSMGGTSAYKLGQIIENSAIIFGIEMLIAAQAIDLNSPLRLSPTTKKVYKELRKLIPFLEEDRIMSTDIQISTSNFIKNKSEWSLDLN